MIFVGYRYPEHPTVFRSMQTPTFATHGDQYQAVVGPFLSQRGADFMVRYGQGNPHCRTVDEAELLARMDANGTRQKPSYMDWKQSFFREVTR